MFACVRKQTGKYLLLEAYKTEDKWLKYHEVIIKHSRHRIIAARFVIEQNFGQQICTKISKYHKYCLKSVLDMLVSLLLKQGDFQILILM